MPAVPAFSASTKSRCNFFERQNMLQCRLLMVPVCVFPLCGCFRVSNQVSCKLVFFPLPQSRDLTLRLYCCLTSSVFFFFRIFNCCLSIFLLRLFAGLTFLLLSLLALLLSWLLLCICHPLLPCFFAWWNCRSVSVFVGFSFLLLWKGVWCWNPIWQGSMVWEESTIITTATTTRRTTIATERTTTTTTRRHSILPQPPFDFHARCFSHGEILLVISDGNWSSRTRTSQCLVQTEQ